MGRKLIEAIAYIRTSSAKDSGNTDGETRQRQAIKDFALRGGYEIVAEFCDPAHTEADRIESQPGFTAALEKIEGNSVRTIIVETAHCFARDLIMQGTGFYFLQGRGINLVAADSPGSFIDDAPTAALVRQILGAAAQLEKAVLTAKFKGARDRKRRETGKCEGRKSHAELRPEAVALAKHLREASSKAGERQSFRAIGLALAEAGFLNERGRVFNPQSIKAMLG